MTDNNEKKSGIDRRTVLKTIGATSAFGTVGGLTASPVSAATTPVGELGTTSAGQWDSNGGNWFTLDFEHSYDDPVVVMGPLSTNGEEPAHARLRAVWSGSAEWQIEEWRYMDLTHTKEDISYLVVESGDNEVDGASVHAGTVEVDHEWQSVTFGSTFDQLPVVFTESQTVNGGDPIVTRTKDVTESGFSVRVQGEEARGSHVSEEVGYIAIDGNVDGVFEIGTITSDEAWTPVTATTSYSEPAFVSSMQTTHGGNTAGLRRRKLDASSAEVRVEEEESADDETNHVDETVGYLLGRRGRFDGADGGSSDDGDDGGGNGDDGDDNDGTMNPTFGADFAQHIGEDPSQYYEDWLGRSVLVADEFMKKEAHYHNVPDWKIQPWTNWVAENDERQMAWDLMVHNFTTLEDAANGGINDAVASFGNSLVNNDQENSYIRIVGEFDLGHTINPQTDQEKQWFVEMWREMTDTLRSVSGQDFTIVWNPNYDIRYKGSYAEDTWPGDGYVDMVGIDIYDRNWDQYAGAGEPTRDDHIAAWDRSKAHLDWFRNWADDHEKELCIPEWGVWEHTNSSHGGGDNPYFVQEMYDWMNENDVAWHVYFEQLDKHALYGPETQFPEASSKFKELFG
ncbi:glycosyl hydrolase [Halococcus saccharolyticus]|uniref:GH26 domain-containing protein n=1 Tax=Halococcus saccharolyticus DSM 5350 TaxID=1227455 RepID=M0MQP5_9EURY|nr:glycosyl hydrolase [Halococcus saccharolyticus]EMA47059.1 hypothetical protein C449_02622 [Halococcus saccharolyticus DSM 5350]